LRTLEVNCGLWHGQIGIEEHGELAKLAGSVVGFLGMIGGAAVPNNRGSSSGQNNGAEEAAAVTRDKVCRMNKCSGNAHFSSTAGKNRWWNNDETAVLFFVFCLLFVFY
jgi:hypothetical protein